MGEQFEKDLLLSHSAKDKAVVLLLAERLQVTGRFISLHLNEAYRAMNHPVTKAFMGHQI